MTSDLELAERVARAAGEVLMSYYGRPPEGHTSASYCELVLEHSGVVLSPGGAYGPNGEGFFRISLTVPDERLGEAVERLTGSLAG